MNKKSTILTAAGLTALCTPVTSAELSLASSNVGNALELLRGQLDRFEAQTGHTVTLVPMPDSTTDQFAQYRVWLSAQSSDVDLLMTDIVWAPQLAEHFEDLRAVVADQEGEFLPALVESQTVQGRLVALPLFTSAPALFYRTDLLEKYGAGVPTTWAELTLTSKQIMEGERASGNPDFWGYVFQGSAYEGLTCNVLEWVRSSGGGPIISADGSIDINMEPASEILKLAGSWVGSISPEGVLSYQEEESRGVWQLGNAAFMRNWPYAWTLGNFDDSAVKGKFAIAPLPSKDGQSSSPTLGGWNVAVSKYSDELEASRDLAEFLISKENQIERLRFSGDLPTLIGLYQDSELADEQPELVQWLPILESAVARPSAAAKGDYNEVSAAIWSAAHAALASPGHAEAELEELASQLNEIKGTVW